MSNLKIFPFNLVTQDVTTISADSVDSQFPLSNIKDDRTTRLTRSLSSVETNSYVFDMITADSVDAVLSVPNMLKGYQGIVGDITIKANIINGAWGTAPLSETLSISDEFGLGLKLFSTLQNYRFWQINITGTFGFIELPKLFIGRDAMRDITNNNINFGWTKQKRDGSTFKRNRYKQRFSDKRNTQDIYKFSYKLLNKNEMDTIVDVLEQVGETTPFWLIVDSDASIVNDAERFAGYFYLRGDPVVKNAAFGLYDLNMSVEQAL